MEETPFLPFVTRKMLRFEHGAEFELTGVIKSSGDRLVRIAGFTKERPFTFQIQTGPGFTLNQISFRLPEIPIAIIISDDSAAATQNSVYIELNLSVEGKPFMHLLKGTLGPRQPLGWPDSPPLSPLQKRGQMVILVSGNPAPGAEASQTTEASSWIIPQSIFARLTTNATVANRRVAILLSVGGTSFMLLASIADQTASQTVSYSWAAGATSLNDATTPLQQGSLPLNLLLLPETTISTFTENLQAGDNFTVQTIYAERFLSPE